jgi:hypothetical protein
MTEESLAQKVSFEAVIVVSAPGYNIAVKLAVVSTQPFTVVTTA